MALVFDSAFELLNDTNNETYINELATITKAIAGIVVDPVVPASAPNEVIVKVADEQNNVLNNDIRERFQNELVFASDDIFSQPITTTITMEGFLSNVRFTEEEFIKHLADGVSKDILVIDCNFGKYVYPGYIEPVKIKTNNRGRKKKVKETKQRKKQGTGKCFNSQITFQVRAGFGPEPVYDPTTGLYHVPSTTPVYKFKVFRTGKLQLPGAKPNIINDVLDRINVLVGLLNLKLHHGETDINALTSVINMSPVMKNYKFILKAKKPSDMVDLGALKTFLLLLRGTDTGFPVINDVKYTREETKLFIEFKTPIHKDQKKHTRVNIFMSGKVNILGAYDYDTTLRICEYLYKLFQENFQFITCIDVDDFTISESDYNEFILLINNTYNDIVDSAISLLKQYHYL